MDWFNNWLAAKAAIIFAAVSGAVIHVTLFWSSPAMAARQVVAGILFGLNMGPAMAGLVSHYTFFSHSSVRDATICASAITGIYLTEGLVLLARRWSKNPTINWSFWRKP